MDRKEINSKDFYRFSRGSGKKMCLYEQVFFCAERPNSNVPQLCRTGSGLKASGSGRACALYFWYLYFILGLGPGSLFSKIGLGLGLLLNKQKSRASGASPKPRTRRAWAPTQAYPQSKKCHWLLQKCFAPSWACTYTMALLWKCLPKLKHFEVNVDETQYVTEHFAISTGY
jgi:hypothetical protein